MKNILFILSLFILNACVTTKKVKPSSELANVEKSEISTSVLETKNIVYELASDENQGRQPGTDGYNRAATFVENYLKDSKVKGYFNGNYKDTMEVRGKESYNIVGLIGDKNNGKDYILLGAHLDHLGPSKEKDDAVYNGANDNASGVTAVLQIAQALALKEHKKNIIVALFTGEESGLLGSKHLAKRLKNENITLSYMLNFEMIGTTLTTGPGQVYITGYDMSNLATELNNIVDKDFVKFLPEEKSYNLYMRSDNYAFFKEFGVPSHTLSSFDFKNYDYYHKAKDEADQLDIENMNLIIQKSIIAVNKLIDNEVVLKMNK